tara:strand:- start:15 stop:662 length:648 start_codon:yes stop_codon:yes gene_type:complete
MPKQTRRKTTPPRKARLNGTQSSKCSEFVDYLRSKFSSTTYRDDIYVDGSCTVESLRAAAKQHPNRYFKPIGSTLVRLTNKMPALILADSAERDSPKVADPIYTEKDYREQIEQSHEGCLINWNDHFLEKKGECYVCGETKKLVHMTPSVSFDKGKKWIKGRALCEHCEEGDGIIPFRQCNLALDCGTVSDLGHDCPSCLRLAGNKDWDSYLYLI